MTEAGLVNTAGLTVNMRLQGEGPPLLFLGGSNFDLSIRAPVFESALTQHFQVAAADPRGLGRTQAPDGPWTMQDYARDAIDLLDALGWQQVDVLGESFGAMVAMHMAAMAPARIRQLALAAGSAGGAGGSSYPIQKFLQIEDPLLRARSVLRILDTRFSELEKQDPSQAERLVQQRLQTERQFMQSHDNARGYPRLLETRSTHDAWNLLPDIRVPTLVFHGLHDAQAPSERARRIAEALPQASLHAVDAGHSLCFSSPLPVETIIGQWLGPAVSSSCV